MEDQLIPDPELTHTNESRKPAGEKILQLLPAAVYTCDKHGRITFFNEQAAKLWGYRPPLNDDNVRYCAYTKIKLADGKEISPAETPMATTLAYGRSFRDVEVLVEAANERKFYISISVDPILDENGNVDGGICFFQDISRHMQTQLELSESEIRYRTLIEKLEVPLYTTDKNGTITLYNNAAVDLWGREPETGIEKWSGAYKLFYVDRTELAKEDCPHAVCLRESKPIRDTEILVMRPDGSIRHVAPYPQPTVDERGNLTGAVNLLLDLTAMKKAEVALRESEQKYRRLAASLERKVAEKSRDLVAKNLELQESEERYHKMVEDVEDYAIILMDENGIIRNWNKGAEKIKGYTESEMIGKSFETFYTDKDRANRVPESLLAKAKDTGKAISEGWRKRKDGSLFWASILITALRRFDGELIGFTKVTRDLTDKKIADDKLMEYSSRLEFQNRELEQFAYAASHDMKEPLRKIHLYHSYISENKNNILDDKSKDYLLRSINAVKRMNTLIEDLLSYSRITSDNDGVVDVDLNQILDEIRDEHTLDTDHQVTSIDRTDLPVIKAIPFQCKQLFDNLVENAIKYRDPTRPSHIRVTAEIVEGGSLAGLVSRNNSRFHKISVEDNGLGFDQKYSEKIFEVFQRLSSTNKAQGSGIGLAICRKIVQHHGGFITASGKIGEGARFDIYFPTDR
ncbi:MAG: PAS domain S-box protein [Taibaiella sp.]|nr:PAS domain S-box protein [Taibaiella sp.]